jgi:ACS family tartrate transporter-like MFS transporter
MFGFGAGLTFIGYSIFELPSNLALEHFGARKWLARIMITWGIIGCCMAIAKTPMTFYIARFLLGAAEAGLFPGVILYLTYWFPKRHRARYISMFAIGIPLSNVIGSPISGLLLEMDGIWGFKGWQWLYVLEAFPAVILGFCVLIFLADRPEKAKWLSPEQKQWLIGELDKEKNEHRHIHRTVPWKMFADRRVHILAAVFFLTGVPSYGLGLWMPQIVSSLGFSNIATGFITSFPFIFGCFAMVLWGNHSDRAQERVWHTFVSATVAFVGLIIGAVATSLGLQLIGICIAAVGIYGIKGPFLTLISEVFESSNAASGIALVSMLGSLSGFVAPYMVGFILDRTGSYQMGLTALGLQSLIGGLVLLICAKKAWLGKADNAK